MFDPFNLLIGAGAAVLLVAAVLAGWHARGWCDWIRRDPYDDGSDGA